MIKRIRLVIVGLGLLLLAGQAGWAGDRYVVPPGTAGVIPGSPYNTWTNAATNISTSVSAASAPETVWVSNGTYYPRGTISISKGITVRSLPEYGAALTVIDNEYPAYTNRVFDISHADVVVDGFTIKGGWGSSSDGGGARIQAGGGTIQNCIITSNTCGTGAGIYIYGDTAGAYVRNCTIVSNRASTGGGMRIAGTNNYVLDCAIISNYASGSIAGIWLGSGSAVISNCDVKFNESATSLGGIFNAASIKILACRIVGNRALNGYGGGGASLTIEDSVIASNYSSTSGGGLYGSRAYRCTIEANQGGLGGGVYFPGGGWSVSNCIIRNNVGATNGGGVYFGSGSTGVLQNCQVYNNTSTNHGGGAYCDLGGKLYNCLFYNNVAKNGSGGGVFGDRIGNNAGVVSSCTIVSNYAANNGGGLYIVNSNNWVTNSIICSNTASGSGPDIYATGANTNAFFYCCALTNLFAPNRGNITNNPSFNNPAANNYRLVAGSPCINAGTNQGWMTGMLDVDDRVRIRYGTVDVGCYECVFPGMVFSAH